MCKEDLKLGRGRFIRKAKVVAYGAVSGTPVLGEDATRVAIIISYTPNGPQISGDFKLFAASKWQDVPFLTFKSSDPALVLRIEDLGELVTSAITGDGTNMQSGELIVQGVYTDVKAEPMAR